MKSSEDPSRISVSDWLVRNPQRVLVVVLVVPILVVAATLLMPRKFVSQSSFTAQSGRGGSNLSGLAAQLGLPTGSADAFQNPAFYGALLQSRQLLDRVLDLSVQVHGNQTTILKHLSPGANTPLERERARKKLGSSIVVRPDAKTGLIHLIVSSDVAVVAAAINAGLLRGLNELNMEMRQNAASAERRFAQQRLEQARGALRGAEVALAAFLRGNRDYSHSPDLRVEFERLSREVGITQQLFLTLAQAQEQARIDEARDTPIISIVEPPEVPLSPAARGLAFRAVAGLGLGISLVILLAFWIAEWRPLLRSKGAFTSSPGATLGSPQPPKRPRADRLAVGRGLTGDRTSE